MPKIVPSLPAPATAAAEQSSRGRRSSKPAGARGGFDDALSGARRKEALAAGNEHDRKADRAEGKRGGEAAERTKRRESPQGKREAAPAADESADEGRLAEAGQADRSGEAAKPAAAGEAHPSTEDRPVEEKGNAGGSVAADQAQPGVSGVSVGGEPGHAAGPAFPTIELPSGDERASITEADAVHLHPTAAPDGETRPLDVPRDPAALLLAGAGEAALLPEDGEIPPGGIGEVSEAVLAGVAGGTSLTSDASRPARPTGATHTPNEGVAAPAGAAGPNARGQLDAPPAAETSSNRANAVEAIALGAGESSSIAASPVNAAVPSGGTASADLSAQTAAGVAADLTAKSPQQPAAPAIAGPTSASAPPEARFAEDNHANIIREMRSHLMPGGGTMRLRLDPPELGPLAVTVRLRNGVMEASFEASGEAAARLLSHSLGALKTSLESHGVHIERLHVQQAPRSDAASQQEGREGQQQGQDRDLQQEQSARQEQQRREMIRRMWRKLSGAEDPLDMVA